MAQHAFLKSIKPVNLLSFGPNTEEIELRPLNILIGPNGSGKSNLIELIGLLSALSSKDPWSTVIETGGPAEWVWKGTDPTARHPSLTLHAAGQLYPNAASANAAALTLSEKADIYSVELKGNEQGAFEIVSEVFTHEKRWADDPIVLPQLTRDGWLCTIHERNSSSQAGSVSHTNLNPNASILSLPGVVSEFAVNIPHIREFAEELGEIAFYRDWHFGVDASPRDPQPAGLDSRRLDEDMRNLAQVLKAWRDRGDQSSFRRMLELIKGFYEPARDIDVELLGTHLRIMLKEENLNFRTPSTRLSDGTLRWLALLTILLNPSPSRVVCIEEPELGLHPDILPTLADLLVEASTRTQLIVTTHSRSFIDAFTDTPEAICVCEKVEGSTVIERLDKDRLKDWLDEYSLGKIWTRGAIGGNRW